MGEDRERNEAMAPAPPGARAARRSSLDSARSWLSSLPARLSLGWIAARRLIARALRGEVLDQERYAAFISYRHIEPDRKWAIWLHGVLESFVVPPGLQERPDCRRIGRVFRDEEELAASPNLSEEIKRALDRSDWLIVVCSPRSRASAWVDAEIGYFRELQRGERILALLIDGEPASAFPTGLQELRPSAGGRGTLEGDEPLAADVRATRETAQRTAKQRAKLRLLAAILGCRFDDLRRREHERQLRRTAFVAAVACVVAAVVGFLAFQAELNRREAVRERSVADEKTAETTRNESIALTALADTEVQSRPVNGAKLALAAWPRDADDRIRPKRTETLDVLGEIAPELRERWIIPDAGRLAVFAPDGSRILTGSRDGHAAQVWDVVSRRLIAVLRRPGVLWMAALAPDWTHVVTVSRDEIVQLDKKWPAPDVVLWDLKSGGRIATLEGHEAAVVSVAFSPDGTRIVTASDDKTARLWDPTEGRQIGAPMVHEALINSAAFSPDGKRIVTASSDKTARIWDAASGRQILVLKGHESEVSSAAFSADGKRVLTTALYDKTARVWDAASGRELAELAGPAGPLDFAAFSPDGTRIVTVSREKAARVWDAASGRELFTLTGHNNWVDDAAFSPDGMRIVTASDDSTARLWDARSGRLIAVLAGHEEPLNAAAFSPDGMRVVTVSRDGVRLWDAFMARTTVILAGHELGVENAAFSADGTRIVTASDDKTARVWGAASGKQIAQFVGHAGRVNFAAFSPDGARVVTASSDNTARVWDVASGGQIAELRGHEQPVNRAAFSPDGTRVVTASDDESARVWDASSGQGLAVLLGHTGAVRTAAFSADGSRVVTISDDQTVRLWDAASGRTLESWELPNPASSRMIQAIGRDRYTAASAFSPDGTRLITAFADGTAQLRDNASMRIVANLAVAEHSPLSSVAFSPDGQRIVVTPNDGTARVLDSVSGRALVSLAGHKGPVYSAAFSLDGTRVVTASEDGTARVWDVSAIPKGNILQVVCALLRMREDPVSLGGVTQYPLKFDRPICVTDPPPPDFAGEAAQ
jgi:WD40 repeat protein